MKSPLTQPIKAAIVLAAIATAGFVIAAVVTYPREDWPAKYFYVPAMIWLIVVIALKKRAKRDE